MVNTFTSSILIAFNKERIISLFALMILLLSLFSMPANAAQINVSVDRNPIALTDSFELTFTATVSPDSDPNFELLQQDFDIINQRKSSQLSWVNGSTNRTIQWSLTVMAKRSGELQIPAISFGNDASQPIAISVVETTPSTTISDDNELFLEVEASPTDAYVQAQVLYTVRLYHRINLAQAALSDPELDNAVVEKIAEDSQFNKQIKGITYRVTERKYAIFPQKSGPMTIAPLVLTAEVITGDPRSHYNSFFSNQNTQTKRVISKAIKLNIQAAPATLNGANWLPAAQLTLKETWSNDSLQVKVGEPITRTITLLAKGATSSQLPDLSGQQGESGLKNYPDQAVVNDQSNADGVVAMREQKIAFIPSAAGNFILPAIDVPWFNTQTQKMETARLSAVTLVAIAAEPANTTVNDTNTPTAPATQSSQQTTDITPTSPSTASNNTWMWASIGFGFAWLLTLLFIFWPRLNKSRAEPRSKTENLLAPPKLKETIQQLKTACADNNPQAAQQALIKWATVSYNITNLVELSAYCDADLKAELIKLNHALYAKEKLTWDGSGLLKSVLAKQAKQSSSKNTDDDPLVPLYPSQR